MSVEMALLRGLLLAWLMHRLILLLNPDIIMLLYSTLACYHGR
jgi:hypothetical protein